MPRFDGTGPNGEGAMTGRRMGKCNTAINTINENSTAGKTENGLGRRGGRGLGQGKGSGRRGNGSK